MKHYMEESADHLYVGMKLERKRITGPELVQLTVEKVAIIRQKLKEAQDRQKSWADIKRRSLEFHPGDKVYLRVSPTRGVMRFGEKGKLSSRYIGPFGVLGKVGR
ncbi:UNVERIFIED_CONTAM: hypothetical protein Slati_4220500 [Sesamum latifolium]|uniref:Tf2-1-like SH3-like domain-containing protein n=1 Tax=Sesamum latifolium TaxID=2727402 RepID=A0AAW2TDV9_9LAMI